MHWRIVNAAVALLGCLTSASYARDILPLAVTGEFARGNSPRSIVVEDNYTLIEGSTLTVGVGGTTTADYDHVHTTGTLTLGGAVEIVIINGYGPRPGDTLTLLSADGGITGSFGTVILPDSPGITWQLFQTDNEVILKAVAVALADFRSTYGLNADGSDDHVSWANNGVANLLYFMMGLGDPRVADIRTLELDEMQRATTPGLPLLRTYEDDKLAFTFVRRMDHTGLTYEVQVSSDLTNWTNIYDPQNGYSPYQTWVVTNDATFSTVTLYFYRRAKPTFLRVRIIPALWPGT